MMEPTELREALREKNSLLIRQTKRIELLEEKFTALRKKYFQLKYADVVNPIKIALRNIHPSGELTPYQISENTL